jgi:hypothetical protein
MPWWEVGEVVSGVGVDWEDCEAGFVPGELSCASSYATKCRLDCLGLVSKGHLVHYDGSILK